MILVGGGQYALAIGVHRVHFGSFDCLGKGGQSS